MNGIQKYTNMKWIIYGIIALVLLGGGAFMFQDCSHKKQINTKDAEIARLSGLNDSIVASKIRTIEKIDTVTKYVTEYKFRHRAVDSIQVYEIIKGKNVGDLGNSDFADSFTIYKKMYEDTLVTEDFELPYRITLWGDIVGEPMFGKYILFDKTITKEHIVYVPKEIRVEERKSHLYIYGAWGTTGTFNESSYSGGFRFIYKTSWSLGLGYQRFDNTNIYNFEVGLKIL